MLSTHSEVQAASVAVPTILHLEVARNLMEAGIDVLIEKPVAATLGEADELLRLASAHKRVAQVGHLERFNPAVRATLPLINRPMFFEVHRLSVFSPRSLDVDVVLDLMIHDLDVVLTFVKSKVKEIRAVGLPILSGKVDIANVRIEFESGCVANFTASRVSTERVRKLRFFQPGQYISTVSYTHLDVYKRQVRRRMTGVAVKLSAAKNFPPVTDTSEAAWATTLEQVRRVHDELIAAVEKSPEKSLGKQVPGKKGAHYNFYYMLHGVVQHELYHAGQIALLKKMS